jgi:hypothetical protein
MVGDGTVLSQRVREVVWVAFFIGIKKGMDRRSVSRGAALRKGGEHKIGHAEVGRGADVGRDAQGADGIALARKSAFGKKVLLPVAGDPTEAEVEITVGGAKLDKKVIYLRIVARAS